jgi:hypothetical protein
VARKKGLLLANTAVCGRRALHNELFDESNVYHQSMHIVDIVMIGMQVLGQMYALFRSRIPPYMSSFLSSLR